MRDLPYIAEVAALMGDPARANMLTALKDDGVLSATELTHVAGVAPSTASEHLAKLTAAELVVCEPQGRHRYYRLGRDEVADALEALEALAVRTTPSTYPKHPRGQAIRMARTCYDHLAGTLGVNLTWSMVDLGYLRPDNDGFQITKTGAVVLSDLGINLDSLRAKRRKFTRRCTDWSEPRPHLGGALGASLFSRLCELGWLKQERQSRIIQVTTLGKATLKDRFDLKV